MTKRRKSQSQTLEELLAEENADIERHNKEKELRLEEARRIRDLLAELESEERKLGILP
jgi:DNA-directed RNA polymerase specialized sigma24 family protein